MAPSDTPPVVAADPSTAGPSYIGVPGDYQPPGHIGTVVRRDDRNSAYQVRVQMPGTVQYVNGDEWSPANTPEVVLQLQSQLAAIGFLNADNVRPGLWDSTSASAYKKVLGYANAHGITAQEAIRELGANPTLKELQGGTGRAPLVVQQTNPLDIAATAQDVALKMFGRRLTEEELKPFIAQAQASEVQAQKKAYTLGGTDGKGGTVVVPPSVQNSAEDYFQRTNPGEAYGYAAAERMNEFFNLLGSPVSGAG